MAGLRASGDYKKTLSFLESINGSTIFGDLDKYGQMGVDALSSATPYRTGRTAGSWDYVVTTGKKGNGIYWINTNTNGDANIAILLQYGHGTGTGGYVAGYDYINPAIRPIFDQIADEIWKKITSS